MPYLAVLGVVAGAGTALASLNSGVPPVAVVGVIAGDALYSFYDTAMRAYGPKK